MWKLAAQILQRQDINLPSVPADQNTVQHALDIFYAVMGAIAMLLLVIAALRYVISSGEPQKTAEVKRMIIYTFIGLIIIVLAATITNAVITAHG